MSNVAIASKPFMLGRPWHRGLGFIHVHDCQWGTFLSYWSEGRVIAFLKARRGFSVATVQSDSFLCLQIYDHNREAFSCEPTQTRLVTIIENLSLTFEKPSICHTACILQVPATGRQHRQRDESCRTLNDNLPHHHKKNRTDRVTTRPVIKNGTGCLVTWNGADKASVTHHLNRPSALHTGALLWNRATIGRDCRLDNPTWRL